MMLEEKYVFHIPLYKYENGELLPIDISDILDDLIRDFTVNGYENLYVVNAKGYYRSRRFDEKLIVMYISSKASKNKPLPHEIFEKWFKDNNGRLRQEALGYEHNDRMFVERIQ